MRKDIVKAHLSKRELYIVCVGPEIFECVKALSKTSEGLGEIFILALKEAVAIGVETTVVDAALEAVFDECSTGGPITLSVGNVVLHTGLHVNLEFNVSDWTTKASIKLSGVFIVIVVFGVTAGVSVEIGD